MAHTIVTRQTGFLTIAAVALAMVAAFVARSALDDEPRELTYLSEAVEINHLRENFYLVTIGDTSISVLVGSDGVLLVDTYFRTVAHRVQQAIRQVTDLPATYIINSHGHPDHLDGNAYFKNEAENRGDGTRPLEILAHEGAVRSMIEAGYEDAWLPTRQYSNDGLEVKFGTESIIVSHPPSAHTDGDSVVYFPTANIIVIGDLYTQEMYPFVDLWKGGTISGLINALDMIVDVVDQNSSADSKTLVVASHGGVVRREDVVAHRNMIVAIREQVLEMVAHGMSARQIRAANPTAAYDSMYPVDHDLWPADAFVNAVYADVVKTGQNQEVRSLLK